MDAVLWTVLLEQKIAIEMRVDRSCDVRLCERRLAGGWIAQVESTVNDQPVRVVEVRRERGHGDEGRMHTK